MKSVEKIYFEQPLNEHTRVCLRLELLFEEINYFFHDNTSTGSTVCISKIVDALNVLDRPDLRAKLAKELNRYHSNLLRIKSAPKVDQTRLAQLIKKLDHAIEFIHRNNGKFAQSLRENEFLNNIKQHLGTPGGICLFDTPNLYFWLKKPYVERQALLKSWVNEFTEIRNIACLFLNLTRESSSPVTKIANNGFFQASLDPQLPSQLIRIAVPGKFVQISSGRYGISARFFEEKLEGQHQPATGDVSFELTCCVF